ncbi:MAG: hypothetical protein WC708_19945 [Lentisphaeria bacterium]
MKARCPHCKSSSRVNDSLVGRPFICPECKATFTVEPSPRCPRCNGELDWDVVLCVHCGFHLARGEAMAEASLPLPPPPPPPSVQLLGWLFGMAPGLFRPLNVLLFLLFAAAGVAIAGLAVMMFRLGLFFETLYLGSFAMLVYAQGAAFLFLPQLHMLKSAFAEIEGDSWSGYLVVLFTPPLLLIVGMVLYGRFHGQT